MIDVFLLFVFTMEKRALRAGKREKTKSWRVRFVYQKYLVLI